MKIIQALLLLTLCVGANGQALKRSVTYDKLQRDDCGLPVVGTVQPVKSSLDRASLWSVGCETLDRDYAVFENFKQYVGETGVGFARIQSGADRRMDIRQTGHRSGKDDQSACRTQRGSCK